MYVCITISTKLVQFWNAPELLPPCLPLKFASMEVTFGGIVMLVRLVQPMNDSCSIVVTKGGIVKLVRLLQLPKQLIPIVSIVDGNEILARFIQLLNAESPIPVTVYVVPSITKLSKTVTLVTKFAPVPNPPVTIAVSVSV